MEAVLKRGDWVSPLPRIFRNRLFRYLALRAPGITFARSGHNATRFSFARVIAVAFQVTVQARAANSQNLRGPQAVPLAHFQHALDMHFAYFLERQRPPFVALRGERSTMLQVLGQISNVDEVARRG